MIVTIVNVFVKPENVEQFIAATMENHQHAINEPGNLRFDVCSAEIIRQRSLCMRPTNPMNRQPRISKPLII